MKNITEIIKSRRATPPRFLSKKEVAKQTIEIILENANWAPNHKKTEPWRFKVYTGSSKNKLAEKTYQLLLEKQKEGFLIPADKIEKFKTNLLHVPVVIAIIFQRDVAERLPEWEEIAAVSMAVQNMWLTATELGLGGFWATPTFVDLFDVILGIQPGQKSLGFFFLGEIAMDYPSPGRGEIAQKSQWMNDSDE
jgi:nitroreductase